jgi:hypothetical protein
MSRFKVKQVRIDASFCKEPEEKKKKNEQKWSLVVLVWLEFRVEKNLGCSTSAAIVWPDSRTSLVNLKMLFSK